jgi:Fur family transcriptional regulator, ferric uptake regulator
MTVSSHTRPLAPASVTSALGILRARGHRISASRRLVTEALFAAEGPVSAEAIAGGLGGRLPRSDLASVYRNLDTLEAAGLARHVHLGHGPGLYAVTGRHDDGYAACERCGAHVTLDGVAVARIAQAVRAACGFEAGFLHFPILGLCPGCSGGSR